MNGREIHLENYFRIIVRRKLIIAIFFIITIAIVIFGTFTVTPIYQASTKVLIERNFNSIGSVKPSSNFFGYDFKFYEIQVEIIKSPPVAKKVIEKLRLLPSENTSSEASFKYEDRKISIGEIAGNISIQSEDNSNIVTLHYKSKDPEFAKDVVNTIVQPYIEHNIELKIELSKHYII